MVPVGIGAVLRALLLLLSLLLLVPLCHRDLLGLLERASCNKYPLAA